MMQEKKWVGMQIASNSSAQLGKYFYFSIETDQETQSRMYPDFFKTNSGRKTFLTIVNSFLMAWEGKELKMLLRFSLELTEIKKNIIGANVDKQLMS